MFRITADITISSFKGFKPTTAKWNRHVDNYADSASITMPALCKLLKTGDQYDKKVIPTGKAFTEGMPVVITAGYDGNKVTRFKGFIKRINYSIPLEVECEGYSYLLRTVTLNKSYKNTTVKKILEDVVAGTGIRLSKAIPDIPIPKAIFQHASGVQVLEFFKEKCLLTVFFNFDELYVGLRGLVASGIVRHRLGWNVVKDNELLFNADKEFATVNIQIEKRLATGHKRKAVNGPKDGNTKVLKVSLIDDAAALAAIAAEKKKQLNNKGYTGKITAFLEPYVAPGMSDSIEDGNYPDRTGVFFCEGVEGSITPNGGGRQKIAIGFALSS